MAEVTSSPAISEPAAPPRPGAGYAFVAVSSRSH